MTTSPIPPRTSSRAAVSPAPSSLGAVTAPGGAPASSGAFSDRPRSTREEAIAALKAEGLSATQIAARLGLTKGAVLGVLYRQAKRREQAARPDYATPTPGWTPDEDVRLVAMLREGVARKAVAASLGRTLPACDKRLAVLGVRLGLKDRWDGAADAMLLGLRADGLTSEAIALRMGRTPSAVLRRLDRLRESGVAVPAGRPGRPKAGAASLPKSPARPAVAIAPAAPAVTPPPTAFRPPVDFRRPRPAPLDVSGSLARLVAAHVAALPDCGWTPDDDLALAEGLMAGWPPCAVAEGLGVAQEAVVARYRDLCAPARRDGRNTIDGQAAVLVALRARVPVREAAE